MSDASTSVLDSTVAAPAEVRSDSYLTLHYRISVGEDASPVVTTFDAKPATLQLGAGQLAPALEARLIGLPVGEHRVFEMDAGAAFGPRNPDLVQRIARATLEAESDSMDYVPGDVVEFNAPGGGRYAGVMRALDAEGATFDFNHPLAGQPVRFEVRIIGIL